MYWNIAGLTLINEIRNFFGTRSWKLNVEGDKLSAVHEEFDISIKINKEDVNFRVVAEAKDDPSDKLDIITNNPMRELTDFLSAGLPGGAEIFKTYASNSSLFSKVLRRTAAKIRRLGPKKTATFIKQAILILEFDSLRKFIASVIKIAIGAYGEAEAFELFQEMKKKGWDVREVDTEAGRAGIRANFHDLYDIEIVPESVNYEYEYTIEGYPESIAWGNTEDPIREFENWVKSDRFQKASEERNDDIDAEELEKDAKKTNVDDVMETTKPVKKTPEAFAPTVPSQRKPAV